MKLIFFISGLLILTGCASNNAVTAEFLKHSNWRLVSVSDSALSVELSDPSQFSHAVSLQFIEALQVTGHSGCNRFFGEGELKQAQLKVSNLGMTRKFCGEQSAKLEQTFMAKLSEGVEIIVEGETLTLVGSPQFVFTRQ
ncbi:META domain-containing protein [Pseudoalteromonas sp. T1lg65]|uniref:META domain-containing protein n=1 Tax=Pseudoalteromonas sp. T1lg65 TaxID=2077101 RepID=UPI003F7A074E